MVGKRWWLGFSTLLALPVFAAEPSKTAREATFSKDVAPIFERACQNCHRPGFDRADVAADLSGRAAVGAVD